MKKNKIILGLTGGIASGKSTVLSEFRKLGAHVFDCDLNAREVVSPGKPAYRKIVRAFGKGVLRKDALLDRKLLGEIVFEDPRRRRQLEKIVHPEVERELRKHIRSVASGVYIADIPLLYEAGFVKWVEKTCVVWAPPALQLKRLIKRSGLTRREAFRRIRAQWPIGKKRKMADFVIDASGSLSRTRAQVRRLYGVLTQWDAQEYIFSLRGKYKGKGLMKALMEERRKERKL